MFESIPAETERIAKQIVDSAFQVHKELGPGLLESVYEPCLVHELKQRGLKEAMTPLFDAQLLTYLKLTKQRPGLLINFNVPLIKDGIKRIVL